jgi:hypothetical protein
VIIGEEWTNLETTLKTAVEESIGKVKRDLRMDGLMKIVRAKNRKYQSMVQTKFTRAAREEYCEARRKEKRIRKKKRKDYYEKQFKCLQEYDAKNLVGTPTSK